MNSILMVKKTARAIFGSSLCDRKTRDFGVAHLWFYMFLKIFNLSVPKDEVVLLVVYVLQRIDFLPNSMFLIFEIW